MKISIIIPTHNRAETLRNAIESVIQLADEAEFEVVIVDNNSNDMTKQVAESYSSVAKYVFERRTSFTAARKAGADNATGDILLYLDDDVLVRRGSLKNIVDVFTRYEKCGIIAGRIDPKYVETPPPWTLECQKSFNGWSLFNPETYGFLREEFQEVPSAAGPMMAIRRTAYDVVGGFPPDTVGVETNKGPKSFNKLYIGPGDYGLCLMIRNAGFKVLYSSAISVFHVIPPIRFTVQFWRSRMIGEGYYQAIAQRGFFHLGMLSAFLERFRHQFKFKLFERKLISRLETGSGILANSSVDGVSPDELWVFYYKAYLDMDYVLRRFSGLWKFLWEIGDRGVSDEDYDEVINRLPNEYKELVSNDFVHDTKAIDSLLAYDAIVRQRGYYQESLSRLLKNERCSTLVERIVERIRKYRHGSPIVEESHIP